MKAADSGLHCAQVKEHGYVRREAPESRRGVARPALHPVVTG